MFVFCFPLPYDALSLSIFFDKHIDGVGDAKGNVDVLVTVNLPSSICLSKKIDRLGAS